MMTPLLTGWAMWLGWRYAPRGPVNLPWGTATSAIVAVIGVLAVLLDFRWLASMTLAPAVFLLLRELKPELATYRVFILWFAAPTSFAIDAHIGDALRVGTAIGAGWIANALDPALGARVVDKLSCGTFTVEVTPACSGARLSIRIIAVAVVLAVLKPVAVKRTLILLGAALTLAAAANVLRIAALCLAAPGYESWDVLGVEIYHDASGLVAFVAAYLLLGGMLAWLRRAERATEDPGTS